MLIGTLPTLISDRSLSLAEKMISHPLISGVRYNTGGDSPFGPEEILSKIKYLTDRNLKKFYVDLEGRQVRIARWTPREANAVTLNRDFSIKPPARIHIRNAGWFDLVAAKPEERKVYIDNGPSISNYYFGESQSVHIIGGDFKVSGYLGGLDNEYIAATRKLGINSFMLSFVESPEDLKEFYYCFKRQIRSIISIVLKIESQKGIQLIGERKLLKNEQLMAARDDLFLSFGDEPSGIFDALARIIRADKNAIVASRILSNFESTGTLTMGDISDVILMAFLGFEHFMLSDGMAKRFDEATDAMVKIIPQLKTER